MEGHILRDTLTMLDMMYNQCITYFIDKIKTLTRFFRSNVICFPTIIVTISLSYIIFCIASRFVQNNGLSFNISFGYVINNQYTVIMNIQEIFNCFCSIRRRNKIVMQDYVFNQKDQKTRGFPRVVDSLESIKQSIFRITNKYGFVSFHIVENLSTYVLDYEHFRKFFAVLIYHDMRSRIIQHLVVTIITYNQK